MHVLFFTMDACGLCLCFHRWKEDIDVSVVDE